MQAPVLIKFVDENPDLHSSDGDSSDEEDITDCELFLPISSSSEDVDISDESDDSNNTQPLSIFRKTNCSAGQKQCATVVPSTNKANTNGKKPAKNSQPLWKAENLQNKQEDHKFKANYEQKMDELLDCLGSELSYFYRLFPKELFQEIAYQTMLYSMQTNPEKPVAVKEEDIISFVSCVLYMSIVKLPSTRDYRSSSIGISHVANIMPVNRFEKLKSIIHFADNSTADKDDKLFKIRPLINKINEQLNSIPIEESSAVDEQIIPFKGRHSIKQYNPKKPHKWGFKVFVLSGVSGFSYNFEVYCGGGDNICLENEPELGVSSNVVMRLARILSDGVNHKLYVDNWFNSIGLNVYMFKRGIQMVGTARRNHVGNCPVLSDKEMKQRGHGTFTEHVAKVDGVDVSVVSWFDNKVVTLLSNFIGSEPSIEVKRFSRKDMCHINISCPGIVTIYNKHMGGVDLLDSLLGYYRNKIRSKKWYHLIFFHLLDMSIINLSPPLVRFKLAVADLLFMYKLSLKRKAGCPSLADIWPRVGPKLPFPMKRFGLIKLGIGPY